MKHQKHSDEETRSNVCCALRMRSALSVDVRHAKLYSFNCYAGWVCGYSLKLAVVCVDCRHFQMNCGMHDGGYEINFLTEISL